MPPPIDLLFVRHSAPSIDPAIPASQWHLSDEGRQRARRLAEHLAEFHPPGIIASLEPKAIQTAQIMSEALSLPFQTAPGLHEHLRSRGKYTSLEEFQATIQAFFARPDHLVFGEETADQAHDRFYRAVAAIQAEYPYQSPLAIVSHGTVITLYVSRLYGIDPFPFWKNLGLPCLILLSTPEPQIINLELSS